MTEVKVKRSIDDGFGIDRIVAAVDKNLRAGFQMPNQILAPAELIEDISANAVTAHKGDCANWIFVNVDREARGSDPADRRPLAPQPENRGNPSREDQAEAQS